MCPMGYGQALRNVSQQIVRAAALVDIIDVGGGFPARYPGMEPASLETYIEEIRIAFDKMAVGYTCQLWCEPGRALAAEAESVIVKVDSRRKDTLYINDGAFGTLYDAAHCKWVFPTRGFQRRRRACTLPDGEDLRFLRSNLRQRRLSAWAVSSS